MLEIFKENPLLQYSERKFDRNEAISKADV
jgi:hypothetical protein